jgi:uncharacterized protein
MNEILLDEPFDTPSFDPRLKWYCLPQKWRIHNSCLVIEPDAKTDYWQKTHYGFVADNGHFLFTEITGDVIITTRVRFRPVHQYDQAGLMVRISPQCWLKTSVEYELHEPNRLGAVVTNAGYSDWSTQDFPKNYAELMLRVRRESRDYIVEYLIPAIDHENHWTQIRMAHLHADDGECPVQCGLYACSPIAAGYAAEFDFLKIEQGRVK